VNEQTLVDRYRERAAQLRAIAEGLYDKKSQTLLIKVAKDYEALADPSNALGRANRPFTDL
jgi:hypothetical protein